MDSTGHPFAPSAHPRLVAPLDLLPGVEAVAGRAATSAELALIINVAAAVAVALVGGLLAYRLRQPPIVGYLLAGVAIGPSTPGFVGDRAQIAALAEVGVIFLMFALGIEFSLRELARVRAVALVGTAIQMGLTIVAGAALGTILGWPLQRGLFLGGTIAISSTMVILKTLLDRGEVAAPHGRVLLGMLIVQDLAVVVLIVLLPQLAGQASLAVGDIAITLLKAALFIGGVVFLGARVVPPFMARVERLRSPELFLLTAVALALGTAAGSALLGLSAALGAFLGGLLLTETEFDHRVVAEVVPMRNLFGTLFFVSVGMLIDPAFVWRNLPLVLALALFIVAAKVAATLLAVAPFRLGARTAAFTALGMLQIGEFSYVLARSGLDAGVISDEFYTLILAASIVTIVLTPPAFNVAPAFAHALGQLPLVGAYFTPRALVPVPEDALTDHVVVAGYGRVGRRVTEGLRATGIATVVIEEDLHLVQGLTGTGTPAIYGDATAPVIFAAAHPERARLIVVALPDSGATQIVVALARQVNPNAPIVARLTREEDEAALREAGVTAVVAPEQAGAVLLLEESARLLDVPPPDRSPTVAAAG
jgi:monovalent cation:H+ antiporter-2, CPA2 family